jgi:hypothetical protein
VAIQGQTTVTNDNDCHPMLYYAGCFVLDRHLIPPYTPRKALNPKSFPFHDACIFVWAQQHPKSKIQCQKTPIKLHHQTAQKNLKGDDKHLPPLFPPTIPEQQRRRGQQQSDKKENDDASPSSRLLIKVNPELILSIRKCHLGQGSSSRKSKNEKKINHGPRRHIGKAHQLNDKQVTGTKTSLQQQRRKRVKKTI